MFGIFSMTGTLFERANLVFLPYCSSDAHIGDGEQELDFQGEGQRTGKSMS
jgi:hypothetical protein